MKYTQRPEEQPARHAWDALSLRGEPLELELLPATGDSPAYWRFRFLDREESKEVTMRFRVDSVESVTEDDLAHLRKSQEKLAAAYRTRDQLEEGCRQLRTRFLRVQRSAGIRPKHRP